MKFRGQIVVGLMLFMLATLAVGLGRADAGSCLATSKCTFDLTSANVSQLNGNVDVRVTWDNSATNGNLGTATVFSVQWISGGPGTPKFIDEFGFNSSAFTIATITGGGLQTDWGVKQTGAPGCASGCQIDGFGNFATDAKRTDGGFGISAPIVFTLAGKITNIPDNDTTHNAEFVVHIAWGTPECSGFVSDGTTSSISSNTNCAASAAVPEPGTLALFGSGLVSVGALLRKRLFNRGRKEEVV
jgi:hypothetical protein